MEYVRILHAKTQLPLNLYDQRLVVCLLNMHCIDVWSIKVQLQLKNIEVYEVTFG